MTRPHNFQHLFDGTRRGSINLGQGRGSTLQRLWRMTKFFADDMVGKLARLLRAAGYDTLYERAIEDVELARRAEAEDRVVLTRHGSFAARTGCKSVFFVESPYPLEQLVAVTRRFLLDLLSHSFERCIECNETLVAVGKEENRERIPPLVWDMTDEYHECPMCKRLYWRGTHCDSISHRLQTAQELAQEA